MRRPPIPPCRNGEPCGLGWFLMIVVGGLLAVASAGAGILLGLSKLVGG